MTAAQPIRLALLAASPMYYQVPLYQRIAACPQIEFTAIFASSGGVRFHEAGYGHAIRWDVDLLQGYRSTFLGRADKNAIGGSFFALSDIDIVEHLRRGQYEVLWLHGYNFFTHQLAAWSWCLSGKPLLIREEQTLLHPRPFWKRALKSRLLPLLFRRSSALYIGTENRRWFQNYGVPEERMFFTPYCVDNDKFQREASTLRPQRDSLRAAFGIPRDSTVILTVARLIPKKQPRFLLEAFKQVRASRRCSLLIVGSGELEGAVREQIRRENIPDVHLAGFVNQSQISKAYACADVFVLASKIHETWGLVVNEAMSCGLPVVVSNKVGCAVDLVREGENGFVVSAEDSSELGDRLAKLVDSAQMRSEYGARSSNIIKEWSIDVAASGVVQATAAAVGPARWNESHEAEPRQLELAVGVRTK